MPVRIFERLVESTTSRSIRLVSTLAEVKDKLRKQLRSSSRKPLKPEEKDRVDEGSIHAKLIREAIEAMAPEFTLIPTNPRVEGGYDPNADLSEEQKHLDYNVFYKGKLIAILDTVHSNYSFEKPPKPTGDFRVKFYKGEVIKNSTIPAFVINELKLEPCELQDRCFWIQGEEVLKYPHHNRFEGGKMQHNYYVDKYMWKRGLQSFIDNLRKIAKNTT